MKRLILALLLAFTVADAKVLRRGGTAQAAATANILSETFNGAGYDNSWTEDLQGSTVDEDDTTNPPLTSTGFATQQLEVVTAADFNTPTTAFTFAGAQAGDVYCRVYVYVADETLSDATGANIIKIDVSDGFTSSDGAMTITLDQAVGGQLSLGMIVGTAGVPIYSSNISVDTGYRLEFRINDTTAFSEMRINGVTVGSGSSTDPAESPTRIRLGIEGQATSPNRIFFDSLACGDNGWLGA